MQQNERRAPWGLLFLFYQLGEIGLAKIPPVTLSCVLLQVAIYLRLLNLPWNHPREVCISAYYVLKRKEYMRIVYGALEHADDWHLYFNMLSFALKGRTLEKRYGSIIFFCILSIFTVLTGAVIVALNSLLSGRFGADPFVCGIGFSGVIFALKVLTTHHNPNTYTQISGMGVPLNVPVKYAVWIELFLIQLFVPEAGFFGHLAGILVGAAFVKAFCR